MPTAAEASLPMLEALPPVERDEVLARARHRRFARREVLFREGDPGDALYLLLSGHVAIQKGTDRGDIATVGILGPGDVLGELALVGEDERSATAVALEPVEALSVSRNDIALLRDRTPAFDRFLVQALAATVRRVSGQLLDALVLAADQRVRRQLLALSASYGGPGVRLPVTQVELATLAGTSRATVNKVLRAAEAAGAVRIVRGGVEVLDADWLARRGG